MRGKKEGAVKVKITISSEHIPVTVMIQGPDESADKLVEAAKKFLRMRKFWQVKAQMSFQKENEGK